MPIVKILLLPLVLGMVLLGIVALLDRGSGKAATRRLDTMRQRHSESTLTAKMEAQLRKSVSTRKSRSRGGSGAPSRIAALEIRLHRTGRDWTAMRYIQISAGLALAVTAALFLVTHVLALALAVGVAIGAGLPHMAVSYLIKKRLNGFVVRFPDAIELLVRGLRSGLPVTETLGVVAHEVPGPVGEEFKLVTERIRIGRSMEEALQETAERLAMAEFNFFCITLAIQRETGGNLAETLANLADVLRKRAQMKLKIRAMSSESKASAYIVGSLPFMVAILIEWANPSYLAGFLTDQRLMITGAGGFIWMGIGAFIMAKMVSFEI